MTHWLPVRTLPPGATPSRSSLSSSPRPPIGGRSLGDIFNEVRRGHYHRGSTGKSGRNLTQIEIESRKRPVHEIPAHLPREVSDSPKFQVFRFTGQLHGIVRTIRSTARAFSSLGYHSFAYSALAAMRIGMSGSASFQRVRKS